MADVTLDGLRVCREIALTGSFSAAARTLGYSQPAISRQVAAMEAAVGYRLFAREVRGVSLTPAGAAVVAHAARILGAVSGLHREIDALGDRLAGRVTVGAFPASMAVLIPRAVARLSTEHPGLVVAPIEAATPTLLHDLRSGRLQVAVIATGQGLPDYDLDEFARYRLPSGDLCVAVPTGHRLDGAGRIDVRELIGETWIVGAGSAGDPQFGAWPTLTDPVIGHRVAGWPARLGLVAAGLGICLIPGLAARSVPRGVTTVIVDDPSWSGRAALALTEKSVSDGARAVVAALRTTAEELQRVQG
ncbi:LysR family transcriptional regulator [Mycolicibacterium canariasense]|uniref:Probable hydrogen peroxide-inducible genes activator n=1 Tax=Mycolicibacterium canariasense TaxID=228230 RepID=A0A117IAP4_MYCCR|nr:LysR family transcriptional regulator [Mycolicibacterium canariasense]MCV7210061.1 LysR family transcriptional regulator [Mycolicibacterium canariasense]ORV04715.1 LysR family transcriptional regulator [Mycolicibacterium canariasense]GAS96692.1 LysR family transcriptional regulator [Mycolicibacterium canariasense]